MTTLIGIKLSKKVAELYGINAKHFEYEAGDRDIERCFDVWLHEDSARCFELAHEHWLVINFHNDTGFVGPSCNSDLDERVTETTMQAYRTAILQCLVAMKEQEGDGTHPNQTGPWS